MNRRSFLGIVTAFTAAAAAGVKMPTGAEVTAPVAVTAKTPAVDLQDSLSEFLKSCCVTSVSQEISATGMSVVKASYVYIDGGVGNASAGLADWLEPAIAGKRPIHVSYSFRCSPVCDAFLRREANIEVTWA